MIDEATLQKLEFDRVGELLAAECASRLGKNIARRVRPAVKPSTVRHWLDQVSEMMRAAETVGLPPMGGVRDIRAPIKTAEQPAGLEADELALVSETLSATADLQKWFGALPEEAELLRGLGERVGDYSAIAAEINLCIDSRGKVMDSASPKLKTIRNTIEKTRGQIDVVFERLLRQQRVTRLLQYANVTFHDDRRVLPVRAEHRGRVKGIVHRSSDSGATHFVEPAEAVELNNTVMQLREQENKEIGIILSKLSRLIYLNEEGILRALDALTVLDLIRAKTIFARKWEARCPEIREDLSLLIQRGRHPLLLDLFAKEAATGGRREVVPIDVRLGDDFDLLVITGPNTGGKTVAIKTIGLLSAMVQAGIPVPVGPGSHFPVYQDISIDIGDEQSLEQSLSTFSSHMSNMLAILERANRRTLVLLDELGAGTDPEEGAAIGRAIIDELLRIEACAVISTHLSVLKAAAYTLDRVDNGCVEFDVETLRPTFRLRIGEPGNSNALIIAERLGMSRRLVEQARQHLDQRHQNLRKAIDGTLASRRQAEEARHRAGQAKLEAEEAQRRAAEQQERLAREQADYQAWVAWINHLTPGEPVHVKSFDKPARVVRMQLHKQTAVVSTGSMEIEVRLNDIARPVEDVADAGR